MARNGFNSDNEEGAVGLVSYSDYTAKRVPIVRPDNLKPISQVDEQEKTSKFYREIMQGPWYGEALNVRVKWLVENRAKALIKGYQSGVRIEDLARKYVRDDYEISQSLGMDMIMGALEKLLSEEKVSLQTNSKKSSDTGSIPEEAA